MRPLRRPWPTFRSSRRPEPPAVLEDGRRDQYLRRLGFDEQPTPDVEGLAALHRAHLQSFPFENLDIHVGRAIRIEPSAVVAKLLDRRRGGYCYELNGAFASLLTSLGFTVSILEARVYSGERGDGGKDGEDVGELTVGIRFDHACLRVGFDDGDRLADVGFGSCFRDPIEFRTGIDQHDPNGVYRLIERADGWLDLAEDGQPRYRLSTDARSIDEFADGNEHQQTSPDSPFTRNTVCSLATERGRVTLRGLQLIETVGVDRIETELSTDRLGPVLVERFGIEFGDEDLARLVRASER